jgi:glycosyltransferase involved in cell wall biosynthesis
MIIINDSPTDESYHAFASSINDPRIHYHVNNVNKGVNFSRNVGLDKVSADSKWVILLDDDDYLAPDALQTFHDLIIAKGEEKWFVTNRAQKNGKSLTQFPRECRSYTYMWGYLIFKRLKGDATHCIETKLITDVHARFSQYVKQGEEWFFFYQIGLHSKMYYLDHNSTITDGYDTEGGLNFRERSIRKGYESLAQLFYEASALKIIRIPFILYLFFRTLSRLIPRSIYKKLV